MKKEIKKLNSEIELIKNNFRSVQKTLLTVSTEWSTSEIVKELLNTDRRFEASILKELVSLWNKKEKRIEKCEDILNTKDITRIVNTDFLDDYLRNGWKMRGSPMPLLSCYDDGGTYSNGSTIMVVRVSYKEG